MDRKSCDAGHLASHQFLVTLHMQKVGEIGWQSHILLTTAESYLSSPFGSTQKCLARQGAKCVSACMNIGMISEGEKTWRDSSATYVCVSFCECVKHAHVCIGLVLQNMAEMAYYSTCISWISLAYNNYLKIRAVMIIMRVKRGWAKVATNYTDGCH